VGTEEAHVTMLVLTSILSGAAVAAGPLLPEVGPMAQPPAPFPRARVLRDVGIGVSTPGIALSGTGLTMVAAGAVWPRNCGPNAIDCFTAGDVLLILGGVGAVLGTPFLAAGIPMWAVGRTRLKANEEAAGQGVRLDVLPVRGRGAELSLSVRF
jgi:hypothetical protein